ncbi:MAG: DUF3341 domain-containing protein [Puniceicoccales bacterium]|jgi:hypothetical protein|nr:DUF3341 domain-containing protein [Puniceicoccales bacterium]
MKTNPNDSEGAASNLHGLICSFTKTPDVYHAAEKVRDAGFKRWDVYTPFPVHGMDQAMGLKRSKVPCLTLLGGITGFVAGSLLTWWMNAYDYPLVVGGKPLWSPIFPFPIMYECTILFAAFGTFFGQFLMNMLPRHNHPVFNYKKFVKASDDTFFIVIDATDPRFDLEKTRMFLKEAGGESVEEVWA